MQHKTMMMTGAAALALAGGTMVAPMANADPIPVAASYADLLEPVPDAMARVHADDARMEQDARMIPAQLGIGIGINLHDHHHHRQYRSPRWYRSHGYAWNGRVWVIGPPRYWHNHNSDWYRGQGYQWDGRNWNPGQRDRYQQDHHHQNYDRRDDHHHDHHQNW